MNLILLTEFGSHVYGTNTWTSDTDIKGVLLPTAREIILQRTPKSINQSTKQDINTRNSKDDVDTELFGLQTYMKLLLEGQTGAMDLLFTPEKHHKIKAEHWWNEIVNNKHHFLSCKVAPFISYCRTQAAKYGLKGGRVAAIRSVIEFLSQFEEYKKIKDADVQLKLFEFVYNDPVNQEEPKSEYIKFVNCRGPNGRPEPHLEVCNRKIPFHATVKYANEIFTRIFNEYGHRALLAEKNEGIDWKALSHSIRVCYEGIELLNTGNITFPRPEAELLLSVKKGEKPYKEVASIIEEGLVTVEAAVKSSVLPKEPNYKFADDLVYEAYRSAL